jgi:hypothetical protein
MAGKKTSVYLTDEIMHELRSKNLTVMDAIKLGVAMADARSFVRAIADNGLVLMDRQTRDELVAALEYLRALKTQTRPRSLTSVEHKPICAQCLGPTTADGRHLDTGDVRCDVTVPPDDNEPADEQDVEPREIHRISSDPCTVNRQHRADECDGIHLDESDI